MRFNEKYSLSNHGDDLRTRVQAGYGSTEVVRCRSLLTTGLS